MLCLVWNLIEFITTLVISHVYHIFFSLIYIFLKRACAKWCNQQDQNFLRWSTIALDSCTLWWCMTCVCYVYSYMLGSDLNRRTNLSRNLWATGYCTARLRLPYNCQPRLKFCRRLPTHSMPFFAPTVQKGMGLGRERIDILPGWEIYILYIIFEFCILYDLRWKEIPIPFHWTGFENPGMCLLSSRP